MFDQFDERTISVAGADIHCRVGGQGPPVLLLHGYPQTSAMWGPVADILACEFTVVCSDLRGYGDSSKPAGTADGATYSFRAMAADQVQLMRALGFSRFHWVGHDRGGRTAHRGALDHPDAVASLAVLDIVPTLTLLQAVDSDIAGAYWHWFFLSLPAPLPETMIGRDPDGFFSTSIATWGAGSVQAFDPQLLSEYRRCWNDPEMIRGSCEDYRAALTIDRRHDEHDAHRRVQCPTLALWGSRGLMARKFDIAATWEPKCESLRTDSIDGGHFFVDEQPTQTAAVLAEHLGSCAN